MRTSKSIFQFLKAFEDKASEGKTAIKLPDQKALKNDNAMVTVKTFRKYLRKFFSSKKVTPQIQQDEQLSEQQHQHQPQQQSLQQQSEVTTHDKSFVEKDTEETFEPLIDIDVVASTIQGEDYLSEDVRTDLTFNFNSADLIGHNIKGTKQLLIHLETKKLKEEELIAMFTLVLEDICLHYDAKRLFIYNTFYQMTLFHRLLKLLKIEFFHYDESTNWSVLSSDGENHSLSYRSSYNMLTTPEGIRGTEATECICIIENDDYTLKHITLEGMSRATQNLIVISTSNILRSGHILRELLSEYLMECLVTNYNDVDKELPYTKSTTSVNKIIFNINTQSWQYQEMLQDVQQFYHPKTTPKITNVHELILKK